MKTTLGLEVTEKNARMKRLETLLTRRPQKDTDVVYRVAEEIIGYRRKR